jgi:Protein of unknown function (DUF1501)
MKTSRRTALKAGILFGGGVVIEGYRTGTLFPFSKPAFAQSNGLPHFHIQVYLGEGIAGHYLFDARPRSFTAAGLAENYIKDAAEPKMLASADGKSKTWVSPIAEPLLKHLDVMSVINGVYMSEGFDGHEENRRYLISNNPFGGLPSLEAIEDPRLVRPISVLLDQSIDNISADSERIYRASLAQLQLLSQSLPGSAGLQGVVSQLVMDRARANASTGGVFSQGSDKMAKALSSQGELRIRLDGLAQQEAAREESPTSAIKLIRNLFAAGLTNQVIFELPVRDSSFDTHDSESAKNQPVLYKNLVDQLDELLTAFKTTEIRIPEANATILLRDCCSISISSEFSRTLRQRGRPIAETGTDHNPQGNSVLFGGAGIRPGLVLGATDLAEISGSAFNPGSISEFHRKIDPDLLKVMGLAFDFASGFPIPDSNAGLQGDVTKRINFANIMNTVAAIRGVPNSRWLRSGGARPQDLGALSSLMKT